MHTLPYLHFSVWTLTCKCPILDPLLEPPPYITRATKISLAPNRASETFSCLPLGLEYRCITLRYLLTGLFLRHFWADVVTPLCHPVSIYFGIFSFNNAPCSILTFVLSASSCPPLSNKQKILISKKIFRK